MVFAYSYLDGMEHACRRILRRRGSGEYNDAHNLQHVMRGYVRHQKEAEEEGRFYDAAYIEGYLNVLVALMLKEDEWRSIPFYFCFTKADVRDIKDLKKRALTLRTRKPKAWKQALKIVDRLGDALIPTHAPFL